MYDWPINRTRRNNNFDLREFIEAAPDHLFRVWHTNNAHYAALIKDVKYEKQTMTVEWLKSEHVLNMVRTEKIFH